MIIITKRTKRKKEKEKIEIEKKCINTYGACNKNAVPLVYGKNGNKDFKTTAFCSIQCLKTYRGEGIGAKKVRQLAKKVYKKNSSEYERYTKQKELKKEKPTIIKLVNKKKVNCSFPIDKEPLKNKIKLGITYKLDKNGKYPQYKPYNKVQENTKHFDLPKNWISINPNNIDKTLTRRIEEKLNGDWLNRSLIKWKRASESSLEKNLYKLYKNPDHNIKLNRLSNISIKTTTINNKERVDKNYWKHDYISDIINSIVDKKKKIPHEILYYLVVETYQELYNEKFRYTKVKNNLGGKKHVVPKMQRR